MTQAWAMHERSLTVVTQDLEHECLQPSPSEKLAQIGLALLKYVSSHRGLTYVCHSLPLICLLTMRQAGDIRRVHPQTIHGQGSSPKSLW